MGHKPCKKVHRPSGNQEIMLVRPTTYFTSLQVSRGTKKVQIVAEDKFHFLLKRKKRKNCIFHNEEKHIKYTQKENVTYV